MIELDLFYSDFSTILEEYFEKIFNKFKHLNIKEANNTFDLSVKLSYNYDKIAHS
jgi:hypothetical protein